jgi:hypothetical protein
MDWMLGSLLPAIALFGCKRPDKMHDFAVAPWAE